LSLSFGVSISAAQNWLYCDRFIGGGNWVNPEKTTPLMQVPVKLFHMRPVSFETHAIELEG